MNLKGIQPAKQSNYAISLADRSMPVLLAAAIGLLTQSATATWPSNEPFWPHYPTRQLQLLDGVWDWANASTAYDPTEITYQQALAQLNAANDTMQVPKACDVAPAGHEGPRGTFVYRTTFDAAADSKGTLLQFMGCSFYCRVFVDGTDIGDHRAGGYSPFWLRAPPPSPSSSSSASRGNGATTTREVLVVVNNDFSEKTAPTHTGGDFYNYAGLTRQVLVFEQPSDAVYLHSVSLFPVDAVKGIVHARVVLRGDALPSTVTLTTGWNGEDPKQSHTVVVSPAGEALLLNLTVPQFKPWAIGDPNLFTLTVALSGVDAITVRSGVRVLGVKANATGSGAARLTINGKLQKLYGVNRHTMWPDTGSGLSLEQVQADVALLKQLGVTWVRGAHYAQDQRFVDLLDEAGIGLWEEALGPGTSVKNFNDPVFMQQHAIAMQEMVNTSINHPSVLYHAYFNEGPSDDSQACFAYADSAAIIHNLTSVAGSPQSRLVTYASDKGSRDKCYDVADVISNNHYPCWYSLSSNGVGIVHCTDVSKQVAGSWQSAADWAKQHFPSKPFGISETGGGGVYEWSSNSTDDPWTQKYEAELVSGDASFALQSDDVNHFTVWQFNDIKANEGDTSKCGPCTPAPGSNPWDLTKPLDCAFVDVSCGRPGGENHKGQVDFWRRPKQSFKDLQKLFTQYKDE